MDEAELDMKEIESRTTDVLQEEGELDEAGRSCNTHLERKILKRNFPCVR
jgi:hypothetical protein